MVGTMVIGLALLYAGGIVLLTLFALRTRYSVDESYRPTVAIIVAARNEEGMISSCLESLVNLSYPKDLLDIIIVDDHSSDSTADLVRRYTERFPHVRLLVAGPPSGHLKGKVNAIAQAFDIARGEIVLLTDADCTVPRHWVENTVKYYAQEKVGLVPGFTYLSFRSPFEGMQTLDWLALVTVASGAVSMGIPLTAIGTNLSVRRSAYDRIGGYRSIPFSVTEDYALFRAVTAAGYGARIPLDPETLVTSEPCKSWMSLYRQRKRWLSGGRGMHFQALALFAPVWVFHAGLVVALVMGSFLPFAVALSLKVVADLILTVPTIARFRRWRVLRSFLAFELYFFAYVLFFPPVVFLDKDVQWKERTIAG